MPLSLSQKDSLIADTDMNEVNLLTEEGLIIVDCVDEDVDFNSDVRLPCDCHLACTFSITWIELPREGGDYYTWHEPIVVSVFNEMLAQSMDGPGN